ncbi:kinase-like protein, partial [Wilcoxina mikolae CBS 423.85]
MLFQALSHHDLKPQNLLVFEDRIVIADFGLSSLNAVDYTKTELQGTTYTYGPPELFGKPPVKFGRKADIWSMACVFLEIMSFVSHGLHGGGVKRFSQWRADGPHKHLYSTSENNGSEDKSFHNNMDVVELWLEELDQRQASEKDEVGRNMVKIIVQMMSSDPDSRPTSLEAEDSFQRIVWKLHTNEVCGCRG